MGFILKKPISATIDEELILWIEKEVNDNRRYRNKSHLIEFALELLKQVFAEVRPKKTLVLIGPEGDFTSDELVLAKKMGCIPVSLGDLVLRVATAAAAVVSFIRLYYEES